MSDPFIGQIMQVGFNFAPRGWAMCDGQILSINDHQALFSLLGTAYGGNGSTTFGLPDLRGRVALHQGNGSGLTNRLMGEKSGAENQTLVEAQLPSHTHSRQFVDAPASSQNQSFYPAAPTVAGRPVDAYIDPEDVVSSDVMSSGYGVANTGGQQPISVMQPYTTVNFIIALQGIYPSRN